uniref:DNA helicase n=1 Tax=Theileria annulata TaxID=5874 RepID=A0A3B0NJ55_THEAN
MSRYYRRGYPYSNFNTLNDSQQSNDIFILDKKFQPFGKSEENLEYKSRLICKILSTPLTVYMDNFLDYFLNDYDSFKQCVNYLSIKPSNEKFLIKSSTSQASSYIYKPKYPNENEENCLFNSTYGTKLDYAKVKRQQNNNYGSTSSNSSSDDLGIYETMIGTSELSDITKMMDDDYNSHYVKANNFQSFFLDVTKLLITLPDLGSDLLLAPQLLLILLDYIIIPYFFIYIETMYERHNVKDVDKLMEVCKSMPNDVCITISNDVKTHIYNSFIYRSGYIYDKLGSNKKENDFRFNITTRLRNIPPTPDVIRHSISEILDEDVGNLVILTCTVVLSGVMSIIEDEREYICRICSKSFVSKASSESYLQTTQFRCPNYQDGTYPRQRCPGSTFEKGTYFSRSDYQEIRCQSIFNSDCNISSISAIPVVLRKEICGTCFPGDTVHITGFVRRRFSRVKHGERCESELFIDANNIECVNWKAITGINNAIYQQANSYENFWSFHRSDEISSRNIIIESICTDLLNVNNAKLGLILTLIGGFSTDDKFDENHNRWAKYFNNSSKANKFNRDEVFEGVKKRGNRTRTQCHILFVGDPATGKSHLLEYATEISYRHVSVIGTNCTSVGLTCTIVRDGGDTMLAAGALVLASGGICCIDEFSEIKNDDKSCLHEAMEQQVISVAKSGLKCTLNCQCTIVASSNYKFARQNNKRKYDDQLSDERRIININTPLPLLTRFDLIIVMTDNSTEDLDIVEFLLEDDSQRINTTSSDDKSNLDWSSVNTVKNYIQFVRENLMPSITPSCQIIINRYYDEIRSISFNMEYGGGPTVRTIESIVRLSQAHARLMFRDFIKVFDVVSVILIMEFGLQGFTIGCINAKDQVIDRTGLFSNIKEDFNEYLMNHAYEDTGVDPNEVKFSNGITTQPMYDYFERLLFEKLNLARSENNPEEIYSL